MNDLLAKKLRKKPETINAELLEAAYRLATAESPNATLNMFLIKARMPEYGDNSAMDATIEVSMKDDAEKYAH